MRTLSCQIREGEDFSLSDGGGGFFIVRWIGRTLLCQIREEKLYLQIREGEDFTSSDYREGEDFTSSDRG